MSLTRNSTVMIEEHTHFTKGQGNMVLLNYDTGTYFGLDPIGARFWELFTKFGKIQEVMAVLIEEYDVSEEMLWDDIKHLILQWEEKGLVKVVHAND